VLQEEYVQTLMKLGLTLVQAKAYLALSRMENATIKAISKASNLARQDVYRIMPALQRIGLVEQIITTPTKYKAVPIKNGITSLLENRAQEHAELRRNTAQLLSSLHEENVKIAPSVEDEPQFVITSELTLVLKRLMDGTNASKISIDSIGTWESFEAVVLKGFQDFKKALARGVKIRSITEMPPNGKSIPRCVEILKKHPLYEVRFISAPAPITMAILDKKEMNIGIGGGEQKAVSSLWSNNPVILALTTKYFDEVWREASPYKRRKSAELCQPILSPNETQMNR
jgi:sugar-specific transcriptional regulator TrmB